MPITAETFKLEHFEKLERGIAVAREAYASLMEDRDSQEQSRYELQEAIGNLDAELHELRNRPTMEQWNQVMQFIVDVERGIRSVEELFALAREQND